MKIWKTSGFKKGSCANMKDLENCVTTESSIAFNHEDSNNQEATGCTLELPLIS